jgi:DNA (cytosine-5)-methyltransferase 1
LRQIPGNLYGTQREPNPQAGRVYDPAGISPTLIDPTGHGSNQVKITVPVLTPDRQEKRQNGRRFKSNGEPMFTLTAQDRHGVLVVGGIQANQKIRSDGICPATRASSGGHGASSTPCIIQRPHGYNAGGVHDIAPAVTSNSYADNNLVVGGVYTNVSAEFNRGVLPRLSRTLKADGHHPAGVFDGYRIRKLTPRECWRLQGFPDWAFDRAAAVCSDSQLYKQAGNSVTVPVVREIAEAIREAYRGC